MRGLVRLFAVRHKSIKSTSTVWASYSTIRKKGAGDKFASDSRPQLSLVFSGQKSKKNKHLIKHFPILLPRELGQVRGSLGMFHLSRVKNIYTLDTCVNLASRTLLVLQ